MHEGEVIIIMKIRLATLSQPAADFNDKMLDWGICGLVALAAKGSVLIYHGTKEDLRYLQTIELGAKETLDCLKFHPTRTILAMACDLGIVFWDEKTNETTVGLKIDGVEALEWKDDFLVILRRNRTVSVFDFELKKVIWKLDLEAECNTISIDPFAPFRALFSCSKEPSFIVVESTSIQKQPNNRGERSFITGSDGLVRCFFHPEVSDLLVVVCPAKVMIYEMQTKSVKIIISNESSAVTFKSVAVSPFDVRSIHVLESDATISVFKWNGTEYIKMKDLKFIRELSGACAICTSKLFQHYYICYSPNNGLSLLRSGSKKTFVIKTASFVPISFNCYDCKDELICLGTSAGEIWILNCETAEAVCKFFIDSSGVKSVRFQNRNLVHFMGEVVTGTLNIQARSIKRYDTRSGPALRLYVSDELAIFVHGSSVIGIVKDGVEKPVVLDCKIWLLTPQSGRTAATCFRGDNPNFAVVSTARELLIYSCLSTKPVLSIPIPEEIAGIVSVAWKGDKLVVVDQSGFTFIHDFDFGNSKTFMASPNVHNIAFSGSDILFLLRNGELLLYKSQKWSKCPLFISGFRATDNGLIVVHGQSPVLRLITTEWKSARTVKQTIASDVERLQCASRKILNLETKTLKTIADVFIHSGFLFEAVIVRIIDRFLGGKTLSMKYAMFGGVEEAKERLEFLVNMLEGSSLKIVLFKAGLHAINHDIKGVAETLLKMDTKEESYLLAAIAGSLLSQETLTEPVRENMKMIATSLFANDTSSDLPFLLLVLCGFETLAAQYLQDMNKWDRSIEVLKSLPLSDTTKSFIRKCAYHYFNNESYEMAAALFASIGDFHPLLCILVTLDKPCLAFHIMMYLDSIDAITEFNDNTSNTHVPFYELELVRQQIIQKSEPFLTT